VQENICQVIEGAKIPLEKGNQRQLAQAIEVMARGSYDYICRGKSDLQRILTGNKRPGLSIMVDVDQEITSPIEINHDNIHIVGKWGAKLISKIPGRENQETCFYVRKNGIHLTSIQFHGFKLAINFSGPNISLAVLDNCILFLKEVDSQNVYVGSNHIGIISNCVVLPL
jgi:hypothetical protein